MNRLHLLLRTGSLIALLTVLLVGGYSLIVCIVFFGFPIVYLPCAVFRVPRMLFDVASEVFITATVLSYTLFSVGAFFYYRNTSIEIDGQNGLQEFLIRIVAHAALVAVVAFIHILGLSRAEQQAQQVEAPDAE